MKKYFLHFVMAFGMMLTMSTLELVHGNPCPSTAYEVMIPSLPALPQEGYFLCGDVNEDGFVNVLDIITMVNYIMGGNPSPFNMNAADINADSGINVLDVIAIVNIIMQVPGLPCGCVAPVTFEGYTYPTVQIGIQCWFRENLKAGTMINVNTGGHLQTDNGIIEKYCYDNNPANCDTYGGLYEWNEAMQYVTEDGAQGVCPPGWHIPGDNEWKILEGTVDSQYPVGDPEWDRTGNRGLDAGKNLKTTTGWQDGGNGTDLFGFKGLPAGHRYDNGFYEMGSWGQFWTSTPVQYYVSWHRYLTYYLDGVFRTEYVGGDNGFSVRCIKGCWPEPTQANAGPDQLNVPGTSTLLAANTPTFGSGVWGIVSGAGGTFVDPWSPYAEFQGMAGNEYLLSWTITTDCGSSADTVVISFADAPPPPCGGISEVILESQTYLTVEIGGQCWFKENLNIGTKINSTTTGYQQTDNDMIEKYCYNNDIAYCDTYGGLYEWPEAMQYDLSEGARGICPDGWHIPTDNEFKVLEGTIDSQYPVGDPEWEGMGDVWRGLDAGSKLKSTSGWYQGGNGNDLTGFSALPAGYRAHSQIFLNLEKYAYFHTSTDWTTGEHEINRYVGYPDPGITRKVHFRWFAFNVRCMKDCDLLPTMPDAGPNQLDLPGTSAALSGNTPVIGTGHWLLLSGEGGTIVTPSNPNSEFQGMIGHDYTLSWNIATTCTMKSDTVVIRFFTCGEELVDSRNGQSYPTVMIGSQCWMAKNLNVGGMTSGMFDQWDDGYISKYCYDDNEANCDTYGGLYQWYEAVDYDTTEGAQGLCPAGWHIPTDGEFTALSDFLGGQDQAGGKMKSTGTIEEGTGLWRAPNTGATNESGFTSLPAGCRWSNNGTFLDKERYAYYWSSTFYDIENSFDRYLTYFSAKVLSNGTSKGNGFSVRCLQD
ncbi:MAG TPA: FISUMP domain-containing protein [Bacteroidales bacterium]|nr:FISUMP domain-containing protein [Bacteroidales bacterium]